MTVHSYSIDQFTNFSLQLSTDPAGGAGTAGVVTLERGTVFVVSSSQWVKSIDGKYQAYSNGAQMGVSYLATQNTFQVDCFGQQGVCQLLSPAGITELKPGQKMGFQGDAPGPVEVADCTAWQSLSNAGCVVPTRDTYPRPDRNADSGSTYFYSAKTHQHGWKPG